MTVGIQPYNAGSAADDGTGLPGRTFGQLLNTNLLATATLAGTVNAAKFAFNANTGVSLGLTAVQIIQAAITYAAANGYTAVYIPKSAAGTVLLPYDASQVTFNSAIHMLREGGPGTDMWDYLAYGASGTGSDDINSIQAVYDAIDAAARTGLTTGGGRANAVEGLWKVSKPIWVKSPGTATLGPAGAQYQNTTGGARFQRTGTFAHGPLFYVDSASATIPLTSAIVGSAPSQAMPFVGNATRWYSLREASTMDLNGLGAFCFEFYYKPTTVTADTRVLASGGTILKGDSNVNALLVRANWLGSGALNFLLQLTSGQKDAVSANGTFSAGTTYYICCDYDGAKLRIHAGAPGGATSMVASAAGTGTIVQADAEDVTLGGSFSLSPDSQSDANGPNAVIGQFKISKTSQHGSDSSFTAPNGDFTFDANTICGTNWSTTLGALVAMNAGATDIFWCKYQSTTNTGIQGVRFDGLRIEPNGATCILFSQYSVAWEVSNCTLDGWRNGILATQPNGFFWTLKHTFITSGGGLGRYGFANGLHGGFGVMNNVTFFGGKFPLVMCIGGTTCNRLYVQCQSTTVIGTVLRSQDTSASGNPYTLNSPTFDTEQGVSTPFRSPLAISGTGLGGAGLILNGGSLETGNSAPHIISDAVDSLIVNGTHFPRTAGQTQIMQLLGALRTVAQFNGTTQDGSGSWLNWCTTAGAVKLGELGKGTAIAFASTLNLDCSLRDKFEIGTLTGPITINFINATPGQTITLWTKQDGTGGRVLTFGTVNGTGTVRNASAANTAGNQTNQWVFDVLLSIDFNQWSFTTGT